MSQDDLLEKARKLFEKRKYMKSRKIIEQFIKENPENIPALQFLSSIYQKLHKVKEQEEVLIKLMTLQSYEAEYTRTLGKIYRKREDYLNAYRVYKILVEIVPMAWRDQFNLGRICIILNKKLEAEECFRFALRINPDHDKSWYNLARMYETINQRLALQYYKKALKLDISNDTLILDRAKAFDLKDPNFAEKFYRLLISFSPENTSYLEQLEKFYIRKNRPKSAEEISNKIKKVRTRRHPDYYKAIKMMNQGNYMDAAFSLNKISSHTPWDDVIWTKLGICKACLGKQEEALRALKFALEINKYNMEAIEFLEKIDPQFKHDSLKQKYAHKLDLVEGYFQNHQFNKARELLQEILDSNPEFPGAWHGMGKLFYYLNDMEKSWEHFQMAKTKMTIENAETYEFLGRIANLRGDLEDAEMFYWKSIQIFPENAQTYNNLADICRKLHKFEDMVECYQKSLEINPKQKEVHLALGEWYDAVKDFTKAENFFRKAENAYFSGENLENL